MTIEVLNYRFCALSDPGLARENNEDAVIFDAGHGIAVLADGMGGYNAGEVASHMATTIIHSELKRWRAEAGPSVSAPDLRRAIEASVEQANAAIFRESTANAHYSGMGTTLVMGVLHGVKLFVGHIGDSRCYRLRQGQLSQITKDHSLLQEQIDAGLLTPEQAAVSMNKNLVTRALGVEDAVMVELHEHAVEAGDVYLMCSDGLSDMVQDAEIGKILQMPLEPEQRAKMLVDLANAHGGRDNITVLLVQADQGSGNRGLLARLLGK